MMTRVMLLLAAAAVMLSGCSRSHNATTMAPVMSLAPISKPRPTASASLPPGPGAGAIGSPALRVMSFNVRVRTIMDVMNPWRSRRETLVEAIRQFQPDVLGTQELLDAQADYLEDALPQYAFVGAGRSNGKRSGGEMCGIFYRSDRFRLVDSGHFWLSDTPEEPGRKSWGTWFTRMTTWVKLQPLTNGGASGGAFYVFNTHFDVGGERARQESAKLLRERIAVMTSGAPVVITGDFNTTEGTATYQTLLAGPGGRGPKFTDAYRDVHPVATRDEATRHGFDGSTRGERIDWIIASPGFDPVEAAIVRHNRDGKYPSDHFPVTAVLRLTPTTLATASADIPQIISSGGM